MSIIVRLVAGTSADDSSISVTGQLLHPISDTEIGSFKLNDSALKSAVEAEFGKKPDDAYLKSPTPWGDLYQSYGWQEVTCTLRPKSAFITELYAQPTIVNSQKFENNSNKTASFGGTITQSVTQTATSGWQNSQAVSFQHSMGFSVEVKGIGGKSSITHGLSFTFGQSGSTSVQSTVGSSSSISVVLDPGESVLANLTCNKGTLKARITFEAILSGYTAVNYSDPYQEHHFWARPISDVMESGNISNTLEIVQDVEIGYYSDGVVELTNVDGKAISPKIASKAVVPGALWANRA